jgi:ribosomal protein S18 acetylase RimI-like enzyme
MPRRAQNADVPSLAALYHSVWHETHSAFMPVQEVARRTLPFFVMRMSDLLQTTIVEERDTSIAGFASWSGDLLGQIYVAAAFRGSSLATDLMLASEREMVRQGIRNAELHCVVGNDRARRFYERLGWKHSGEILEKVAGPNGDADVSFWRMRKRLV